MGLAASPFTYSLYSSGVAAKNTNVRGTTGAIVSACVSSTDHADLLIICIISIYDIHTQPQDIEVSWLELHRIDLGAIKWAPAERVIYMT